MDNDPDSKLSEAEDKCEKEETEVPNTTPVDKDAEFDIITQKDVLEASGPQAIQESLLVREEGAIDEAIQQLKDSKITDKVA